MLQTTQNSLDLQAKLNNEIQSNSLEKNEAAENLHKLISELTKEISKLEQENTSIKLLCKDFDDLKTELISSKERIKIFEENQIEMDNFKAKFKNQKEELELSKV